jgi:hypothetical protein
LEFVSEVWDLGDEWCRWAELPFVFAMWTAREGIDLGGLDVALGEARDLGVAPGTGFSRSGRALADTGNFLTDWGPAVGSTATTNRFQISVNGSPYSLFRFPSDFKTRSFVPSNAARISFVVVFPTEPVTPAIFPPQACRTALANCLSASKVSTTGMQRLPISPANRES